MTNTADPNDFKLRQEVSPLDRSRIYNLLNQGGFFTTREIAYAMNLLDRSFLGSEAGDFRFMLVEQKDILLGYACYGLLPLCKDRFHVYWMAITKAQRGKGIGKRLEAAVEKDIRKLGGTKVYAEISDRADRAKDNAPAQFYVQCGYKPVATIHDYYADGDDMLLLEKNL